MRYHPFIIPAVLAVIVAAVALFIFWPRTAPDTDMLADTPAPQAPAWVTYDTPALGFVLEHPPGATAVLEGNRAKVQVLGTDNTPQSEMTDGVTLFVESVPLEGSLEDAARAHADAQPEYLERYEPVTSVAPETYAYTVQSQAGPPITYRFWMHETGQAFVASYIVRGTDAARYEALTDAILETVRPREA